ncbi:MAG: multicopper oxidase domain-containing protein [Pseudomonas sp.]
MKNLLKPLALAAAVAAAPFAMADTVKIELTAKEVDVPIDNAGTTQHMWTYEGLLPGPLLRVKEGDTVEITLHNHPDNGNSHSIDLHAAVVDVLDEFDEVKPGDTKTFTFKANYPGIFVYHCGADSMAEHIGRGMYGAIIVDPKEGYSENYPKPDREYVLIQSDLYEEGTSAEDMKMGNGWKAPLINGKIFHYSPVHDPNASLALEAKPGERVRIFYANAMVNEAAAMHPIAGIWDRVWDNGNPKNLSHGLQTVGVPAAHAVTMDIVPPADRPTNNAIVDHRMKHALNGAISVLMAHDDADPDRGRGDQLILR